jgi:hypothetical protein
VPPSQEKELCVRTRKHTHPGAQLDPRLPPEARGGAGSSRCGSRDLPSARGGTRDDWRGSHRRCEPDERSKGHRRSGDDPQALVPSLCRRMASHSHEVLKITSQYEHVYGTGAGSVPFGV